MNFLNRKKYFLYTLLISCFLFNFCSKDNDKEDTVKSSEKELKIFKFRLSDNTSNKLTGDINGVIDKDKKTVTLKVPNLTDLKTIKAYFEISPKATAKVGSKVQESSKTVNDFSKTVTYTILAEDGTKNDYKITVNKEGSFTFKKLTKTFVSGGSFSSSEILANVEGDKDGYKLKEIKDLSPSGIVNVSGTKPNLSLTFVKEGKFKATIVLEHSTKDAVTIKEADFEIVNKGVFTFKKLTKTFVSGGSFSSSEILANVEGDKDGYKLKEIKDLSPSGIVNVSGSKPNLSLTFVKEGKFKATIVLEHSTKDAVTIKEADFEISSVSADINLDKGFRNGSFRFFYYPKDGKIYYTSNYSIYKMDLDGSNSVEIKKNSAPSSVNLYQYIFVHNDFVYYNNAGDKKIYKMKTDGSNHSFYLDGYGGMKVYGDYFYFFDKDFNLNRIKLDNSGSKEKLFKGAAFISGKQGGGDFHIKNDVIYYHVGRDGLWKFDINNKKDSQISSGLYDGYVFTDNYMYFRHHNMGNYGIAKVDYNLSNKQVIRKKGEVNDGGSSLNVSKNYIVFSNRTSLLDRYPGIWFLSLDGKTEKKIIAGPIDKSGGELKIIGDWVYYTINTNVDNKLKISRVKKDGTSKSDLKTII